MKLQHFAYQGKKKTNESTNKSVRLHNFTDSNNDNKTTKDIFSGRGVALDNKPVIDLEYYCTSKIYDLIEGHTDWYIPKGNHCIIGDQAQIRMLTDYLMKASDIQIDLVDISDFLQSDISSSTLDINTRLVAIETESLSTKLIREVISKCHQIYFYRPKNLLNYCRYTQEYYVPDHLRYLVNQIADGMGMDMKQVLDIWSGMLIDEFLEVSSISGMKAVRRLPDEDK